MDGTNKNKQELTDECWNVLIVDDDNLVHTMIKQINKKLIFENKKVQFHSAHTSNEAKEILNKNNNIALVLLDVFIEGLDSGLKLVEYIRKDIKKEDARIVLMTGNSSTIVEEKIILNYDINGYGDKSDLFFNKISSIILSSLRGYRDITRIKTNRQTMEKMVTSISKLYNENGLEEFLLTSLCHLSSVINQCTEFKKENCNINSLAAIRQGQTNIFKIIGGKGKYKDKKGRKIRGTVDREILMKASEIYREGEHNLYDDCYIAKYKSSSGDEAIIIIENNRSIEHVDIELLNIFNKSISATFDNLCLNIEIEKTQREILYTLGEVTEARSEETGSHVKRVSKYCEILGREYGLSQRQIMLLTNAAPIHDLGKVAIPDKILLKPGSLTKEEFNIVKTHTTIGYNLLKNSNRDILKTAAIVAHQHHERYDGTGYPRGLKGDQIHIYGRISAVADVFDALGSPRVYKKAWVINDILKLFKKERGKQFDPVLVDILFENLDEFLKIKKQYKDESIFDEIGMELN